MWVKQGTRPATGEDTNIIKVQLLIQYTSVCFYSPNQRQEGGNINRSLTVKFVYPFPTVLGIVHCSSKKFYLPWKSVL